MSIHVLNFLDVGKDMSEAQRTGPLSSIVCATIALVSVACAQPDIVSEPYRTFEFDISDVGIERFCGWVAETAASFDIGYSCSRIPTQNDYEVVTFGTGTDRVFIQGGIFFEPGLVQSGAYLTVDATDQDRQLADDIADDLLRRARRAENNSID